MSYQEQTTQDQTVAPLRDEKLATHNLLDTLAADPQYSEFTAALRTAGLGGRLMGPEMSTVFAPSNNAFQHFAGDPRRLGEIVGHHIAPGARTVADLRKAGTVPTLAGRELTIGLANGDLTVNGHRLVRTDLSCTNGVIHTLDAVLEP